MQDWDNLRIFLAVASAGSVTAAASKLGVNQSTVSRRINGFEDELKVRLFERLSTGFVLTPEGEELQNRARRIEEETFAIDRHIMGKNIELAGPVRVTTSTVMLHYLLMPIFKKFNHLHPNIHLHLDLSNNIYNITAREADVAIRITRDAIPENLIGRELGMVGFAIYGKKSYVEAWKKSRTKKPLRWIGEDNNQVRPSWLNDNVDPLQLVMRTNDVLATVDALNQGMGIGRLLTFVGESEKKLTRLNVMKNLEDYPVWLLTHVDMRRVSRVSVFTSFVVDELRQQLGYHG